MWGCNISQNWIERPPKKKKKKNSNSWTGNDLRKAAALITQLDQRLWFRNWTDTRHRLRLNQTLPLHNCNTQCLSATCSQFAIRPMRQWRGGQRGRKPYFWRRRDPCGGGGDQGTTLLQPQKPATIYYSSLWSTFTFCNAILRMSNLTRTSLWSVRERDVNGVGR